jgi:ATP-binding cassette subfamily B protein
MVYDLMYNVKNAQDVRIYSTYDFFTSKVTSYNSDSVSILQTEGKTTAQYSILKRLLIMLQFICVQMFVVNKALAGFISIGEYTMYVNSANSFSTNAMLIVQNLVQIQKNLLYVCEYFDFLDLPSKEFETSKKEKATTPHCIEFQDVSFRYPKSKINTLDHINIKFLLDEKIGIVGKNGAGKTTFIKLLLRLYEPSNGKILLDGKDVREYDYSSYLSMFSAVFQDFNIYPISIRENIVSSNFYDSEKLLKILKELNLYSKLLKCSDGVETVASKLIDATGIDFSTGEKQMISMARAIYKPSSILILDEPTSSLDANAENLLYKKYRELSTKKISFFVSHRLASCIFCDSILVFDKGQIVQQGNHKTLINDTSGLYAQMFNLQAAQYK